MTITLRKLTKEIHFPITQAIPGKKVKGIFSKLKKFLFYRREFKVWHDHAIWSPLMKEWIFLPKGFIYDGASVPKILHSFLGPTGVLLLGSGPHDEGYKYGGLILFRPFDKGIEKALKVEGELVYTDIPKPFLDSIFFDLSERESSLGVATFLAWLAVTIFGKTTWTRERKKQNGINAVRFDFPNYDIKELENGDASRFYKVC